MRLWAVASAACGALLLSAAANADSERPKLCIVPIAGSEPTVASNFDAWRLTDTVFTIPGLPAPVFTPTTPLGQFTISADHKWVSYDGPYPHSYLDLGQWVQEPWSGRLVAVTYGGGVSVLRPGTDQFALIPATSQDAQGGPSEHYDSVALLPRRKQSVVVTGRGEAYVVEADKLQPWLSPEERLRGGLPNFYNIRDLSNLAAILIVDLERNIHILGDDGGWQAVGSLDRRDYVVSVDDLPELHAVLVRTTKSAILLRKDGSTFTAEFLPVPEGMQVHEAYIVLDQPRQVITFNRGGWFDRRMRWRRLGPDGFEDIPGGEAVVEGKGLLTSDRRSLFIGGGHGGYVYDGTTLEPIANRRDIGGPGPLYNLPSIRRQLKVTTQGTFDVVSGRTLEPATLPFSLDSDPRPSFADWPDAGLALAFTATGVYTVDAALHAEPVPGGEKVENTWGRIATVINPANGDYIITGKNGVFAAVIDRSGTACAAP